jgi:hypothetical protein
MAHTGKRITVRLRNILISRRSGRRSAPRPARSHRASPWLRDPSAAEVPAAEVPAAEVPAAEVPAAEVPAAEVPAGGTKAWGANAWPSRNPANRPGPKPKRPQYAGAKPALT